MPWRTTLRTTLCEHSNISPQTFPGHQAKIFRRVLPSFLKFQKQQTLLQLGPQFHLFGPFPGQFFEGISLPRVLFQFGTHVGMFSSCPPRTSSARRHQHPSFPHVQIGRHPQLLKLHPCSSSPQRVSAFHREQQICEHFSHGSYSLSFVQQHDHGCFGFHFRRKLHPTVKRRSQITVHGQQLCFSTVLTATVQTAVSTVVQTHGGILQQQLFSSFDDFVQSFRAVLVPSP